MLERFNMAPDFSDMNQCGNGEWVRYADAQATIADLQGQVKLANIDQANVEAERNDLQQRVAQLAEKVAHYDRWLSGGVYFTKAEYEVHVKDRNNLREEHIKLQADHARVLGLVQALPVAVNHMTVEDDRYMRYATAEKLNYLVATPSKEYAEAFIALLTYRASLPAQPAQGGA